MRVGFRHFNLDSRRSRHEHRVRETDVEQHAVRLGFDAVAHADDLPVPCLKPSVTPLTMLLQQRAGQPVQRAVLLAVRGTLNRNGVVRVLHGHVGVEVRRNSPLGPLTVTMWSFDADVHSLGNRDGCVDRFVTRLISSELTADPARQVRRLPDFGDDFAAQALPARLIAGHDAARGGQDGHAQAVQHARNLRCPT